MSGVKLGKKWELGGRAVLLFLWYNNHTKAAMRATVLFDKGR